MHHSFDKTGGTGHVCHKLRPCVPISQSPERESAACARAQATPARP